MLHFKAYEQILSTKRGAKKGQTEPRVEQAVRLCGNIKNRQERIKEENTEIIIELIKEQNLLFLYQFLTASEFFSSKR